MKEKKDQPQPKQPPISLMEIQEKLGLFGEHPKQESKDKHAFLKQKPLSFI
jgi:hypothetical protein